MPRKDDAKSLVGALLKLPTSDVEHDGEGRREGAAVSQGHGKVEGNDLDAQRPPTGDTGGGRSEEPGAAGERDAAPLFERHEEQVVQAS